MPLRPVLLAVAGLAVAALIAGGVVVLTRGGGGHHAPPGPAAQLAGRLFTTDPAATTDGRDQELTGVAASGSTVVVSGDEFGSANTRGQFLVSTDGGDSFRLANVVAAGGQEPPYGDVPRVVAGGRGAWIALSGGAPVPMVAWTSRDGLTWTRLPDTTTAEFGPHDRVFKAARTDSGFVAVGDTSPRGDFTDSVPAVWLSSDGRSWERVPSDQLKMTLNGGSFSLMDVAAIGNTVLAYGWTLNGDRKVVADGVWRSADGGRTWAQVALPRPRGAGPTGMAICAAPSGFVVVRGGARGGKKSEYFGIVLGSADGQGWTQTGEISVPGYQATLRLAGSERGLAAVVATGGHRIALLRSPDGRSWQPSGDVALPDGRDLQGVAVTAGATIVALRDRTGQDVSGMLAVRDVQGHEIPVDLARVPGAVQPDQTVTSIAAGGGRIVAVGSTNGDAAAWVSGDGRQWSRGRASGATFVRPHKQRLHDVVWGAAGWVAVGDDGTDPAGPLVVTSSDGDTWTAVDGTGAFSSGTPHTAAAAAGPKGYVVVGDDGPSAAAWFSPDLKSWKRAGGDLSGGRWMRGVVGGAFGYVAAGGLRDAAAQTATPDRPAVWTSPDGMKWAMQRVPLPAGSVEASFNGIVARGSVLVAPGTAHTATGTFPFAFMSPDAGRTWQEVKLPGTGQTALGTPVTATPRGFVIAGISGQWGATDVILWISSDGRTWTAQRPEGTGLSGRGDQWLTGLTAVGGDLLAVGATADHRGEQPTLWRRPLP